MLNDFTVAVDNLADEIGVDAIAPVGKDRVGACHLPWCYRAGPERHCQIRRMILGGKTEARDVILCVADPDRLQNADGNHVLRLGQCGTQPDRALVFAIEIMRLPSFPTAGFSRMIDYGLILDYRSCGKALFQRRRIDERLETGTGLAPGLGNVVELVAAEVEATHQSTHCTALWIQRDQCGFRLWQLYHLPLAVAVLQHESAHRDAVSVCRDPCRRSSFAPAAGRRR